YDASARPSRAAAASTAARCSGFRRNEMADVSASFSIFMCSPWIARAQTRPRSREGRAIGAPIPEKQKARTVLRALQNRITQTDFLQIAFFCDSVKDRIFFRVFRA